jgi:hypothetical protein
VCTEYRAYSWVACPFTPIAHHAMPCHATARSRHVLEAAKSRYCRCGPGQSPVTAGILTFGLSLRRKKSPPAHSRSTRQHPIPISFCNLHAADSFAFLCAPITMSMTQGIPHTRQPSEVRRSRMHFATSSPPSRRRHECSAGSLNSGSPKVPACRVFSLSLYV